MQTFKHLKQYPGLDQKGAAAALDSAVRIVKANLGQFTDHFQSFNSFGGFYEPTENVEWTTGFWTGEIWLAYEMTGEEAFRKAGAVQVESFLDRIERRIDTDNHDMGFYIPRPVWRPTG